MKSSLPSHHFGCLFAAALLLAVRPADAALVTWQAPAAISGDSDVSTNGTLVAAFQFLGATNSPVPPPTTVNGVTFLDFEVAGASSTVGAFTLAASSGALADDLTGFPGPQFSNLSAGYQILLQSGARKPGPASMDLTMSGLMIGQTYEFQWWSNQSNTLPGFATTATAGTSVTLSSNVDGAPGALGQHALGTFTADAMTQTIRFSGPDAALVNGFQLRTVSAPVGGAVPEPGTALAGLAACALCGATGRRGRRK